MHQVLHLLRARLKGQAGIGRVKQHVAQGAPIGIHRLHFAHRARQAVKGLAAHPQLAVQRLGRQARHKPGGCGNRAATAKAQFSSVPNGAHAIELFAHQVEAGVELRGPIASPFTQGNLRFVALRGLGRETGASQGAQAPGQGMAAAQTDRSARTGHGERSGRSARKKAFVFVLHCSPP